MSEEWVTNAAQAKTARDIGVAVEDQLTKSKRLNVRSTPFGVAEAIVTIDVNRQPRAKEMFAFRWRTIAQSPVIAMAMMHAADTLQHVDCEGKPGRCL